MNNEPVAWMHKQSGQIGNIEPTNKDGIVPLYTHPSELTDEEIKETIKPIIYNQYMTAYKYGFEVARAILRKAQEK